MKLLTSLDSKNYGVGRLVLAPNYSNNCFLCYSDSITEGTVNVYDCHDMIPYPPFLAHAGPILKLSLNYQG